MIYYIKIQIYNMSREEIIQNACELVAKKYAFFYVFFLFLNIAKMYIDY